MEKSLIDVSLRFYAPYNLLYYSGIFIILQNGLQNSMIS